MKGFREVFSVHGWYPFYVLLAVTSGYFFNQLDRYAIAIAPVPQSILPKGILYQLLVGPVFTVCYTVSGLVLSVYADRGNKPRWFALALGTFAMCCGLTGFATEYWHLVLLRVGLAVGQSLCNPLANSIISGWFPADSRGTAMGIYSWGIYLGYSMSFALGNFVSNALSWRWVFFLAGFPGIALALLVVSTVRLPVSASLGAGSKSSSVTFVDVFKTFTTSKPLLLLCLAAGIRNAGGYVWALNTQKFFEAKLLHDMGWSNITNSTLSAEKEVIVRNYIGSFMSWIPLVAGPLGALAGGFISDRYVREQGTSSRVKVLMLSQLLAAPFAAMALLLPGATGGSISPWQFLTLLPSNIIGEMWVGVCLAMVAEAIPSRMRTSATAFYMFVISNIGGNANILVSPLRTLFKGGDVSSYMYSLLITFPGLYVLSSFLFGLLLCIRPGKLPAAHGDKPETEPLLDEENRN